MALTTAGQTEAYSRTEAYQYPDVSGSSDSVDPHSKLLEASGAYSPPGSVANVELAAGSDATQVSQSVSETPPEADSENEGGISNVLSQIGAGMEDEITNHLGRVVGTAAISLGVAAATVVGIALAPEIALAAIIGAGVYTAWNLATAIPGWVHDASVAANPDDYTQAEVNEAEAGLRGLGAGTVDVAASAVGAPVGGLVGTALRAPALSAATELAAVVGKGAQSEIGVSITNGVTNVANSATKFVSPYLDSAKGVIGPVVKAAAVQAQPHIAKATNFYNTHSETISGVATQLGERWDDVSGRVMTKAGDLGAKTGDWTARAGDWRASATARFGDLRTAAGDWTAQAQGWRAGAVDMFGRAYAATSENVASWVTPLRGTVGNFTATLNGRAVNMLDGASKKFDGYLLTVQQSPAWSQAVEVANPFVKGAGNYIISLSDDALGAARTVGDRASKYGHQTAEASAEFAAKIANRAELLNERIATALTFYGEDITAAQLMAMGLTVTQLNYERYNNS